MEAAPGTGEEEATGLVSNGHLKWVCPAADPPNPTHLPLHPSQSMPGWACGAQHPLQGSGVKGKAGPILEGYT